MGHVMRCLALAEAWRNRGAAVVFRGRGLGNSVDTRLVAAGIRPVPVANIYPAPDDLRETIAEAKSLTAIHGCIPYVLVDGYQFDAPYLNALRDAEICLIVLDDGGADSAKTIPLRTGDIVLNQNVGAEEVEYNCLPGTVTLQGPKYALLRAEFLNVKAGLSDSAHTPHVLVTFGGSDPADLTHRVLGALREAGVDVQVTALVGPAYRDVDSLQEMISRKTGPPIAIRHDPKELPALMASADLAVTAGGSSCLEFACLGVPMVVLQAADNQRGLAAGLERAGAALNLGWHADVPDASVVAAVRSLLNGGARRRAMGDAGRSLVDGLGCRRILEVVAALQAPSLTEAEIAIRPAAWEDARAIWRLANDAELRANSFNRTIVALADHLRWFEQRLADPECLFLVMTVGGVVAAQIRYERCEDEAEIHFAVAPAFRGKGLGTRALAATWKIARAQLNVRCIRGVVLRDNGGSVRAFERAGYTRVEETELRGFACYTFETRC